MFHRRRILREELERYKRSFRRDVQVMQAALRNPPKDTSVAELELVQRRVVEIQAALVRIDAALATLV